jgi:hypothetical protein
VAESYNGINSRRAGGAAPRTRKQTEPGDPVPLTTNKREHERAFFFQGHTDLHTLIELELKFLNLSPLCCDLDYIYKISRVNVPFACRRQRILASLEGRTKQVKIVSLQMHTIYYLYTCVHTHTERTRTRISNMC